MKIQSCLIIVPPSHTQTLFPFNMVYWSIRSFSESLQYLFFFKGSWPTPHTYWIRLTEEGAQRSITALNNQYLYLPLPQLFSTVKNQNHGELALAYVFIFCSCCSQKVPNGDHCVTRKGYIAGEVNQRVTHYNKYIIHNDLGIIIQLYE